MQNRRKYETSYDPTNGIGCSTHWNTSSIGWLQTKIFY